MVVFIVAGLFAIAAAYALARAIRASRWGDDERCAQASLACLVCAGFALVLVIQPFWQMKSGKGNGLGFDASWTCETPLKGLICVRHN